MIGLAGGAMLSRAVASLLYNVSPGDWRTTTAAAVLMVGIVAVAAAVPAGRAVRRPPTEALRVE